MQLSMEPGTVYEGQMAGRLVLPVLPGGLLRVLRVGLSSRAERMWRKLETHIHQVGEGHGSR